MEKALSTRQFAVLTFMAAIAVKMFMLPSLFVSTAGRNGYMFMLAYLAVDLGALALIVTAVVRSGLGFYDLLECVLGKIGARILIAVCVVFILFKTTLMLGEVQVFFAESLFETFSWPIYLIPLLGLLGYAACRSPRAIGRTAEIIMPFILLSIVLLLLRSVGKTDYSNLLPFMKEARGNVTEYSLWLGDYSSLAVFIGKTDVKKRAALKIMLSAVVASAAVTAFAVILSAEFGNIPDLIEYGHNLGGLSEHTGTQNFGRLDLLVFAVWVSSVFIKLMIYFYAATRHTMYVTTLSSPAVPYVIAIVWLIVAYVSSVFVFPTQAALYGAATGTVMRVLALPEQFLIPLVVFIGTWISRARQRRNHVQV